MSLTSPKRYQLKKEAVNALKQGHPWIFRGKVSTAAEVFASGQWLSLVGAQNEILGYGIFETDGWIAVRVLKQGTTLPDAEWAWGRVRKAIARREQLRKFSDAFRAVHGENDGLPGIVVDVYGDTAVLQTYVPSIDSLGRFVGAAVVKELGLRNLLWKLPVKRKSERGDRILRGKSPGEISIREGKLKLTIPVSEGQKSGAFLDLRGLRKWLSQQKLAGKRVLNLFSYTGTLGLAAEVAGAKEIWNVDVSKGALDVAKRLHTLDSKKHEFLAKDIFDWFPKLDPDEKFDVIIVDPPMMASKALQVETALQAYRKLYREAARHLAPKGKIVACCCTARIPRAKFEHLVSNTLGSRFHCEKKIAPEDDHPVAFTEGDYLKLLVYQQK